MSILTKICVVLVLVVSVAASGVFLKVVSVQRSWRDSYDKQKIRADIAGLTAANAKIALDKKGTETETVRGELRDVQKLLADEKVAHTTSKATAASDLATQQGHFEGLKASLTELAQDLEKTHAVQKQLSEQKTALAKDVEDANEVARRLKKEFAEATVQIRRLETMTQHYARLIKDLRAEKAELEAELASAGKGGGASSVAPVPVMAPGQSVSGKVTAVSDGVASINIGSAKGIKEKMVLTIFRGGNFVAHLRIDLVEPDTSAGVILNKKLDVAQGDQVATDLK
ncbi:MAG: hypothetical protein GY794_06965 [bacterium]|nr:hypothetical protein [bacterium]